jgi:uncharacterized membrane protein
MIHVLLRGDGELHTQERCGWTTEARTVAVMNTLNDIALVASSSDHHGFWFLPFTLLWVAVLGAAIWFFVRRVRPLEGSALDRATGILAERYARGEIGAEEYRERLEELKRQQ